MDGRGGQGGTDEGLRRAAAVLGVLPVCQRSQIVETGRAVPLDQRSRPAVGGLREVLVLTRRGLLAALSG